MGKGTIISGGTDGRYTLVPDYDTNKLENEIAVLTYQIAEYDTTLFAEMDAAIAAFDLVIADWDDNIAQVDAELKLLDPLNPEERAEWDSYMADKAYFVKEKRDVQRNRGIVENRKKLASAHKAEKQKKKAKLEALLARLETPVEVWCADLTEDLTGVVATVEVPNELYGTTLQIRPGYFDGADYNQDRDGILTPLLGQSPSGVFYNLAMLPAKQKWKPQYRYGTITFISAYVSAATPKQSCTVSLDTIYSSQQSLHINESDTLYQVPVQYMECDMGAFTVGDEVLIEFTGRDFDVPVIIGFKDHPRKCRKRLIAKIVLRLITGNWVDWYQGYEWPFNAEDMTPEVSFLWDVEANDYFRVEGVNWPELTDVWEPIFCEQLEVDSWANVNLNASFLFAMETPQPGGFWVNGVGPDNGEYGFAGFGSEKWPQPPCEGNDTYLSENGFDDIPVHIRNTYPHPEYDWITDGGGHAGWNMKKWADALMMQLDYYPASGAAGVVCQNYVENNINDNSNMMTTMWPAYPPSAYCGGPSKPNYWDQPLSGRSCYADMVGFYYGGPDWYQDFQHPEPVPWTKNAYWRGKSHYVASWGSVDFTYFYNTMDGQYYICGEEPDVGRRDFTEAHSEASGGFIIQSTNMNWCCTENDASIPHIGGHSECLAYGTHWPSMNARQGNYLMGRHQWYSFEPYCNGSQNYPYTDYTDLSKPYNHGVDSTFMIHCNADDSDRTIRIQFKAHCKEVVSTFKSKWTYPCVKTWSLIRPSYWGYHYYYRPVEYRYELHCDQDVAMPLVGGAWSITSILEWEWKIANINTDDQGQYIDDQATDHQPEWSDGTNTGTGYVGLGYPNIISNNKHMMEFYPAIVRGYWTDPDINANHAIKAQIGLSVLMVGKTEMRYEDTQNAGPWPYDTPLATWWKIHNNEYFIEAICGTPDDPRDTNPFTSGTPGTGHNSKFAAAAQNLLDWAHVLYGQYDHTADDLGYKYEVTRHFLIAEKRWAPKMKIYLGQIPINISLG
jgi:hypothetical protein